MGHKRSQFQVQNLPGIWISELGMMAWMPRDAPGLKKLCMRCRCRHMQAHTELVLSGTRVGQSVLSLNPHPCKGCSHSADTALGGNGSGIHPSKEP